MGVLGWWRGTTRGLRTLLTAVLGGALLGAALHLLVAQVAGAALVMAVLGVLVAVVPLRGVAERVMGVVALVPAALLWFMLDGLLGYLLTA
ncbi:hypothetical protein [Dactylosporangium sp. NPDC051541]|uniref:hypothetical protein n=1 Tax=Dactylosporangium sp. NPDC051541 TaxID=3363977 RepID=UPI0037B456FD